jgi:hypothetical protein
MRIGNQAVLQELAERIDQADAVVIGGGSGLSSAAGYDHYHWSRHFRRHWLPFANSMALPLRWLDSTIAFPAMGNSGGITVNIPAFTVSFETLVR